jgi:hypothetical protein
VASRPWARPASEKEKRAHLDLLVQVYDRFLDGVAERKALDEAILLLAEPESISKAAAVVSK